MDDREPNGIGGWLAFFAFTLGVVAPVAQIWGVVELGGSALAQLAFGDAWSAVLAFEWAVALATAAACLFALARLVLVRRRSSVTITLLVLWLVPLLQLFGEPLGLALLSGRSYAELIGLGGVGILRPFLYAALWTAYLTSSRRVANTYPRADAPDEALAASAQD